MLNKRRLSPIPQLVLCFIHILSVILFIFPAEIKCPVCNKKIATNEIESHLLACLSKPRVSYNGRLFFLKKVLFISMSSFHYVVSIDKKVMQNFCLQYSRKKILLKVVLIQNLFISL